ncbi:MAG: hypothetical protein KGJ89_05135 [Patescibacteria group bacterium]|nr:hypothetical protein [Patescibacteria group bacterium]
MKIDISTLLVSLLGGLLLLLFGWIKADISKLNDKVDKLTETYVQVVGEIYKGK